MRYVGTTKTVTGNYTIVDSDCVILADTTSGALTVTLQPASGLDGRTIFIKKIAGINNITIDGNAAETIDGAATNILATLWTSVTLVCDGSNWFII